MTGFFPQSYYSEVIGCPSYYATTGGVISKKFSKVSKSQSSKTSKSLGTLSFAFCPLKLALSIYRSVIRAVNTMRFTINMTLYLVTTCTLYKPHHFTLMLILV